MKAADGRHLRDDQMIAVYIGAEPRFGRQDHNLGHLRGCARCAQRYQAFVDQMTDVRDEATAEADAIFTPARLEAQRLQILHRLEHASHPARVIQFPSHGVQNLSIFTGTQVRRWIAAAAAAGLFIGLTLGRMSDFGMPVVSRAGHVAAPVALSHVVIPARTAVEPNVNEDDIFSRAEQAQGAMQVPAELEALGALTPIREAALTLPSGR